MGSVKASATGWCAPGIYLILLIAFVMQALGPGAGWAAQSAPPEIKEEIAKQEKIYNSRGDDVPSGYITGRALSDYADLLPADFCDALGKLGSRELNYSSDVDLLFLYDPATLPLKPREEPGQGALRIGNRLVELLQKRDAEGYVFRVDLRLRPSPEVTPIVLPVDAAISYYESSALPWERAAFIRARQVAGDEALGRYFLDALHPFVWRRSLDFGAIGEVQAITRRIRVSPFLAAMRSTCNRHRPGPVSRWPTKVAIYGRAIPWS